MLKKVVVVAASCRFPGVDSATLWPALLEERNLITQADASRWTHEEFLHPDKSNPGTAYTFAAGTLGDISGFDAGFFNISPREAASMDPQQRVLLEMAWELFENAGVRPSSVRGSDCGVYLGLASVDHGYRLAEDMAAIDAGSATGNASSIAANRLSWFYDLHGPSMVVDTACSSSLVAVHQACQAIRTGEISQAIAGGISLHLHPFGFLVFSKASMLSRTGQCHVFDESADGYVRSEGGGLFLLKEYEQALADGNPILAFVAGSAINTTGRTSSLTLPGVEAQVSVMQSACASAGITADQIDYIEAHGTGTPVGDPIEAQAIGQALGMQRSRPLPIGSVKSNLGHLEAASGVAGMAKALLCIKHRQVPATVGITQLNPAIPFAELNLNVVAHTLALKAEGELVVGVNSFGFGGANAHVILTSVEPQPHADTSADPQPLPLMVSARDDGGLAASALLHAAHLNDHAHAWYDTTYHTLLRRDHQAQRVVVISADATQAAQALTTFAGNRSTCPLPVILETGTSLSVASEPVWVFSGNGSQWSGMARALMDDKVFSDAVAEVDTLFIPLAGYSLLAELAGKNGEDHYDLTEVAQPALFAVQVGVVRMLEKRGLKPQAVMGHSVGEVAAAWACGALSLADATLVIYHRSLLQGLTRGSGQMSAVGLESQHVQRLLNELGLAEAIVVAGENSAKGSTVAGSAAALEVLEHALGERKVFVRRLKLDYAFHSASMDPIRQAVIDSLGCVRPQAALIPFYSTVTGDVFDSTRLDAEYWWQNIRQPVLFQGAIERLVDQGCNVFVEVGPHPILSSYVLDTLRINALPGVVIPTLRRNEDREDLIDRTLAKLLIAGVTPDWHALFPTPGRWLQLPNYPWQREHHWHPVTAEAGGLLLRERLHPLLGYPLPNQAFHWENRLDTVLFPTLEDHQIGDAVLFPAAGFTELALTAALQYQPGEFVDIEELEILGPLILSADFSKKVRVRIDTADGSLSITSRTTGESEDWSAHVVARLPGAAQGVMLDRRAPVIPERAADFSGDDHLQLTRAAGLNYGPAYQVVEQGWRLDRGVLARLRIPASIEAELKRMHLHPALLDGAFQLVTQLLARDPMRRPGVAFIPVKLGRIAFAREAGVPTLAEVRQVKVSEHSLLLDFTLYDQDGRAVVHIKDARFRGVRLQRDGSADIKRLDTIGVAMPVNGADIQVTPAVSLYAALSTVLGEPVMQHLQTDFANEVEPLLDSLGC
ncbi:type I polyketide synthase [Pseudomonas syringae]|uniref:type I polyketide synthase n=1 Tax=Pseudomonas syringae TaxID=317 RepID=UPI0009AF92E1